MKWYVVQIDKPDGEARVTVGPFGTEKEAIKELDKQTRLNGMRLPRGYYWTWRQQADPLNVKNDHNTAGEDLRKES